MAENSGPQSSEFENQLVEALKSNANGVTQSILQEAVPNMPLLDLAQTLNKFISQGKIELLRKKNQLVYAWKDKSSDKKCADVQEKIIYEAVKRAGDKGTTPRDLKAECNLSEPYIRKIVKSMEAKRLVKSVNSAVNSGHRKKVIMLYGLEPSHAVTGGTFYSGQEFESEYVDVLSDQCYRYLIQAQEIAEKLLDPLAQRKASFKTSTDISNYINNLKISKVDLKISDVENILESLIYDSKIEKATSNGENSYKAHKPLVSSTALMRMPCGVCQIYKDCGIGKDISPSTCVYLKEWLEF